MPLEANDAGAGSAASDVRRGKAFAEGPDSPGACESDACDRTAKLMGRMNRQRHVLRAVLERCRTPRRLDDVKSAVDPVRERYRSIHTTESLMLLLEEAGALARVDADGGPYCPDGQPACSVVAIVDGVEYLEPAAAPVVRWCTTQAGLDALRDGGGRTPLVELFEREAAYLPVYKRVLELCARDGGASMPELAQAVDADPLMQNPRFYAAHFLNGLEACDAVVWAPNWCVTETGLEALGMLADVRDERGE